MPLPSRDSSKTREYTPPNAHLLVGVGNHPELNKRHQDRKSDNNKTMNSGVTGK